MRNPEITIAKAIGIILMVMAHAGIPEIFNNFIYMFHMPLFFFVSGYCFKDKYLLSAKHFIKSKFKGVYMPYVKWSFFFLFFHNAFYALNIYNDEYGFNGVVSRQYTFLDFLLKGVNLIRMTGHEQLLGGYWFLKELFWGSFILYLTIRYVKDVKIGGGILFVLTILLLYTGLYIPCIGVGALTTLSAFFMVIGKLYKERVKRNHSLFLNLLFCVIVFLGSIFSFSSMLTFTLYDIVPYSICAILGVTITLNVSHFIVNNQGVIKSVLLYIGDHTLEVLTWHFISFKLVNLLIILVYGISINQLAYFPVIPKYSCYWWPLYSLAGICLPIGLSLICERMRKFFVQNI